MADWAKDAKAKLALKSVSIDRLASFSDFDEESGDGLLHSLIEMYLDAGPKALKALQDQVNAKNILGIHKSAHYLKSSSANIGAAQLGKMLHALEEATDPNASNASFNIAHSLAGIETEFRRVCQELAIVLDLVHGKRGG